MINLNYLSGDVYQYNLFYKLVVEDMAKSTNTRRHSIDRSGVHTLSSVQKSWQQPSVKGEGCEGSSARNKVRDLASARWEPLAQRLRALVAHRLSSSARRLRKRVGVLRTRRCQLSRVEGHGRPCTEAAGRVILGASLMDASDWRMDIEESARGFARDVNEPF